MRRKRLQAIMKKLNEEFGEKGLDTIYCNIQSPNFLQNSSFKKMNKTPKERECSSFHKTWIQILPQNAKPPDGCFLISLTAETSLK